ILIEGSSQIAASIKQTIDDDLIRRNMESDRHSPLKADDTQTRSQIVAPHAPFREHREASAIGHDALGVLSCPLGAGPGGDVVVQFKDIRLSLRSEDDFTGHVSGVWRDGSEPRQ